MIAWQLLVDWDNDGDFLDAFEDVSSDLLRARYSAGRANINDDFAAGRLSVTLSNIHERYTAFNSASPLYGKVMPGRLVQLSGRLNNQFWIPRFVGYITEINESHEAGELPTVVLECADAFDRLANINVNLDLQENKTLDQLMEAIRVAANWPANLMSVEPPVEGPLKVFWINNDSALNAFKTCWKQELGGQLFVSREGVLTAHNRDHRSKAIVIVGPTDFRMTSGLRRSLKDVVDKVHVLRAGLDVDPVEAVVFQLALFQGRLLPVGSASELNRIMGDYMTAARNVQQPVPGTDYTANSLPDGSGIDMTAKVEVSYFKSFGGGFDCVLKNTATVPVYLTMFQVRGQPVRRAEDERRIERVNSSAPAQGVFRQEFEFNDNVESLGNYATIKLQALSTGQVELLSRYEIEVISGTGRMDDDHILSADMGDKIGITDLTIGISGPPKLWATKIDDFFIIESIDMDIVPGEPLKAVWGLSHVVLAGGNGFAIDSSVIVSAPSYAKFKSVIWY